MMFLCIADLCSAKQAAQKSILWSTSLSEQSMHRYRDGENGVMPSVRGTGRARHEAQVMPLAFVLSMNMRVVKRI